MDSSVLKLIHNVRHLSNVASIDESLLEVVLPHCTVDQLMHIEKSTPGRDLSPITDKLWKKYYETKFGATTVLDKLKGKEIPMRWMELYEAKLKLMDEAQNKSIDRIAQLYKNEHARKQSRQIRLCTDVPPSENNTHSYGGTGPYTKQNSMKKARKEFENCREVKNLAALNNKRRFNNREFSTTNGCQFLDTESGVETVKATKRSVKRFH